jgi:hypothetical protein
VNDYCSDATRRPSSNTTRYIEARREARAATLDADRNYLDGSKSYRLHLPSNIPLKIFWSLIPYDTQTRSVLQTDQRDAAFSSESGTEKSNPDGSVDIYFGPQAPAGEESNWCRLCPARDGSPYFASTHRSNRGSARRGGPERSSCSSSEAVRPAWPQAKLRFEFQFHPWFLVPVAQIVTQPLLNRALFLFGPPA